MAMDKKADYVGNHGGAYTDIDGMSRQFTYIDHDKKTSMGRFTETPEEAQQRRDDLKSYKEQEIEFILARPAIFFVETQNIFAEEFILRDPVKGICWNEPVVRAALDINDDMRSVISRAVTRENTWNTPKQAEQFRDLEYDEFIAGKWREIIK